MEMPEGKIPQFLVISHVGLFFDMVLSTNNQQATNQPVVDCTLEILRY